MKYKVGQKVKLDMYRIKLALEAHWGDTTKIVDLRVKGGYNITEIIDIDPNEVLLYRVSPKLICDYYDENGNLQRDSHDRFHEDYFISIGFLDIDDSLFEL